ncbi:MAG: NADH-quinone oxidoreductase subunit N [Candidatus Comchoanobacterales bacterium]
MISMLIMIAASTVLTALGTFKHLSGWTVLGVIAFILTLTSCCYQPDLPWLDSLMLQLPLSHAVVWVLWGHLLFYLIFSSGVLLRKHHAIGEYVILVLCAYLGMMVVVSTTHLLVWFVGLELMSLSLYGLVALGHQTSRLEAALKYLVTGSMASLMILMGIFWSYLGTGTLDGAMLFNHMNTLLSSTSATTSCVLGVVFLLSGLAFKLGLFPFHWWVPDIYEGTAPNTTVLIASAPKLAITCFLIQWTQQLGGLSETWAQPLLIMGVASVVVGNGLAILQTRMSRLLGYSSVAHMGFVALGIWAGGHYGLIAAIFYTVVYVYLTTLIVGQWSLLEKDGRPVVFIKDFNGWSVSMLGSMILLVIAFLGLSGLPPLLGFFPKLAIFNAMLHSGYSWAVMLTTLVVVMTVLGIYYVINIVRNIFFSEQKQSSLQLISIESQFLLWVSLSIMMVFTLFPQSMITWISNLI